MTDTLETLLAQLRVMDNLEKARNFERDNIWPIVKATFIFLPDYAYTASFHTIGMSPQPVILSARALGAKHIYLLHTADTAQHCAYIEREIEREEGVVKMLEIDRADPAPLYRAVKGVLEQLPTDAVLAFDPTSGTNKMVAAVSLLVGSLSQQRRKAHLYFLDFKEFDRELRRPKPGSEYLVRFSNPDFSES